MFCKYGILMITTMTKTELLKYLWRLHCYQILQPLCAPHEIFLLSLAAYHSQDNNFVEFGPFTGHMSAFICSIAKHLNGHATLIDNYDGIDYVDPVALRKLTELNAGIVYPDSYTILNQNITQNFDFNLNPGFVYFDICDNEKTSQALCNILHKVDDQPQPCIFVIDDCVSVNGPGTNRKFLAHFTEWYSTQPLRRLKPFFVSFNKVFLSNFELPYTWNQSLELLQQYNFIQRTTTISNFQNLSVWHRDVNQLSIGHHSILNNDLFWSSLDEIIN